MFANLVNPIPIPVQKKNKGGRPLNSVWEDIQQEEHVGSEKFSASCKYCNSTWTHGEISKLDEHLSNYCRSALAAVVRKYMTKVMEQQDKSSKKKVYWKWSAMYWWILRLYRYSWKQNYTN